MAHPRSPPGSLARRFVGHPAYGIQNLRDDLDRFIFLLHGSDGEQFLTGDHDEPSDRRPHDN
jgi:hypothetical protein